MMRLFIDVEKCGSKQAAEQKRSHLLKNGIYLDHMKFKCVPAKEDTEKKLIVQCFNCQELNTHKTADCKNKVKCVLCGEDHRKKDCTKTKEEAKCGNCGGSHAAWSTFCPSYKEAVLQKQQQRSYAESTAESVVTPSLLSSILLNMRKQIAIIVAEVVTKAFLDHLYYENESRKSNGAKVHGPVARASSIAKVAVQAVNKCQLGDGDVQEVSHEEVQAQVLERVNLSNPKPSQNATSASSS